MIASGYPIRSHVLLIAGLHNIVYYSNTIMGSAIWRCMVTGEMCVGGERMLMQ